MKKINSVVAAAAAAGALALGSCETPTGQGAATGAVIGALVGGAGHHGADAALAGAAIGAATGALIGAAIEADERGYYEGHEADYYPYGRRTDTPGILRSPYPPNVLVDVRGIPRGALVRDPESGRPFRRP
jgi:hypothetical protein